MLWIALSKKDSANAAVEKRLWEAADPLRANAGLKFREYSAPVLGPIFLRFAEVRFDAQCAKRELPSTSGNGSTAKIAAGKAAGGEGHETEGHGRFNFMVANPPFNVNAVDKERLKDRVGPGRRFPFGLPRTDNAIYLWVQLFRSSLNPTGRAGFVMAIYASDARSSQQSEEQRGLNSCWSLKECPSNERMCVTKL